jgi:hypothetical protein
VNADVPLPLALDRDVSLWQMLEIQNVFSVEVGQQFQFIEPTESAIMRTRSIGLRLQEALL